MSRAYRIQVRDSVRRTIRGEDSVGTCLELLEILPREAMLGLLRDELVGRGFQPQGDRLVRKGAGLTVTVDPSTGEVEARSEDCEEIELSAERRGWADEDIQGARKQAEATIRAELRQELEARADDQAQGARRRATERLEGALGDIRAELDAVVNRVTAEALKRKAAQLGRIKEVTEDVQAGSLTIVVEV